MDASAEETRLEEPTRLVDSVVWSLQQEYFERLWQDDVPFATTNAKYAADLVRLACAAADAQTDEQPPVQPACAADADARRRAAALLRQLAGRGVSAICDVLAGYGQCKNLAFWHCNIGDTGMEVGLVSRSQACRSFAVTDGANQIVPGTFNGSATPFPSHNTPASR